MPRSEINIASGTYVLDARPDRIDHRDRPYNPRLISIPDRWPTERDVAIALPYFKRLVLDQGKEGACTGFGLASVINFVLWRDSVLHLPRNDRGLLAIDLDQVDTPIISPYQLYHLARVYDEWEGEDYEGSSCRGAMKGFHKHGACLLSLWPEIKSPTGNQRLLWQADAATRPLGAYYRIDRLSVNDLQSAIYEVGAVYASATVHEGWGHVPDNCKTLPIIEGSSKSPAIGAHAFAIIGYEPRGFIIQNSWGTKWGYHGYAILPYSDWAIRGTDSWVAVRGAITSVPTSTSSDGKSASQTSGDTSSSVAAMQSFRVGALATGSSDAMRWLWDRSSLPTGESATSPLSVAESYGLSLVLENDGRVLRRRVGIDTSAEAVEEIVYDLPKQWFDTHSDFTNETQRLVVYFHGGLNSEADSIKRTQMMAPYFLANGIYPIFIAWRTSFYESILGILEDSLHRFFQPPARASSIGWVDAIKEQVTDATDRAIEVACQHLLVKPVWSQMKQNAESAAARGRGLVLMVESLERLFQGFGNPELHLIGHSAGSIAIGHLLAILQRRKLPVQSCRLLAPACTVDFANKTFGKALANGTIDNSRFSVDVLSDKLELLDSVGPYGKSLLYLISRALEINHKEPVFGMHWVHEKNASKVPDDFWFVPQGRRVSSRGNNDIDKWREEFAPLLSSGQVTIHDMRFITDGVRQVQQTHGSFDNNTALFNSIIKGITGVAASPSVENLFY